MPLAGRNVVIPNLDKFVFCRGEVEFCGFRVKNDGIILSEATIKSVKEFPRPLASQI